MAMDGVKLMTNHNESQVERLIACLNDRKIEVMDDLFHDDATMDWPQSRERVRGAENRRAIYGSFPQLPTITPRRMQSGSRASSSASSATCDNDQWWRWGELNPRPSLRTCAFSGRSS
jgi:hypothetical protein